MSTCMLLFMSFYRFLLNGGFWNVILPFCLVWCFLACHFTVLSRVVFSSMSFYRFVSCGDLYYVILPFCLMWCLLACHLVNIS